MNITWNHFACLVFLKIDLQCGKHSFNGELSSLVFGFGWSVVESRKIGIGTERESQSVQVTDKLTLDLVGPTIE